METSYKEKYEQAIERLKQWDREHPCAGYVLSDRDKFIFPELAESEGEKIKKRITLCLEECVHSDVIRDYEKDECIAWLENIQYTIDHEKREGFHLGYKACLEEQGEQNLAENAKPQSSTPMSYGKELEKRMCEACNRFYAPNTDSNRYSASDLFYAGVKAERDLNTLAWSEEDEQHIDSLLKRLDALCRNKFERTRFAISEDRDWLKSIRPQNRWKPSDEQMNNK